MKARIDAHDLAALVSTVARALPARATVPVLAGIKLTATGTHLTAEAFDYEVSTRAQVTAIGGEPGTVLVSGRMLDAIAKSLPAKPVDLATAGAHLELVCGSGRFTLPTMPVEDYPTLPAMPQPAGSIDAAVLAQAVAQTAVAAGRDDTLPMMTGVRLEVDGNRMSMLATDRYRLVVRDLTWQADDTLPPTQILIPAATLHGFTKTLTAGQVTIAFGGNSGSGDGIAGFEAADRAVTTRLLDGANYPPVRTLFPDTHAAAAVLPVGELIEVVKRVALVADRATPVLLTFTEDGPLTVEAGGSEDARASETLDIPTYAGIPLTVGFNPQYLVDGLAHLGTTTAHVGFVDSFKPAVISPADGDGQPVPGHRYLIMPIRVNR